MKPGDFAVNSNFAEQAEPLLERIGVLIDSMEGDEAN
jgi:hypothetical protein